MAKIYGVDPSESLTPEIVRDAVVTCFKEAHRDLVESSLSGAGDGGKENMSEHVVEATTRSIVFNAFEATGGNFDKPTKESLLKAIDYLRNFSEGFRKPETIQKHYSEIKSLIDKL